VTDYEVVIGLEVHAQLLTKTKLFCGCSTNFGQPPNTNVCPVCLGLPGSLPVINGHAVELAVKTALALDCTIHASSVFARKNYFYPDLPKGYQISQFEEPFSTHGHLDIEVDGVAKRVGITRAHMEEDAGKNLHGMGGDSVVDLNRAGTPLVEIVGEPDLRSSAEAAAYLRTLRDLLVFVGVNDGNLEEGSFRCDANVSIRPRGTEKFGTRCELKNINSFRNVQRAIDAEVVRQTIIVDGGGTIRQETRSFDPDTGQTATLRSKEDAHDYRYFPEPDLPPLVISEALLSKAKGELPESPPAQRARVDARDRGHAQRAPGLRALLRNSSKRLQGRHQGRQLRRQRRAARRQNPWPRRDLYGHGRARARAAQFDRFRTDQRQAGQGSVRRNGGRTREISSGYREREGPAGRQ